MAIPVLGVGYPRLTAPFATFPQSCPQVLVRLACLIHAANVRSEPGSNPSIVLAFPLSRKRLNGHFPHGWLLRTQPRVRNRSLKSLTVALRHDSKNYSAMICLTAASPCVTP